MVETERIPPDLWVDHYGDYLYRYAMARLHNENAAEEVVQETFLAGVKAHAQFRGQGSEQAWLLGILKRKIVDWIRLRRKYAATGGQDERDDDGFDLFDTEGNWNGANRFPKPEQRLSDQELYSVVQGCIKHLPKGQADVFVLSVMEEMDSDDVCRELSITPSNFWVRLHRARLRLANCVSSRWANDEEKQHAAN